MIKKLSKIKFIAVFFVGVYAGSLPSIANADWSIIGLGTLGGTSSSASAINELGQVAGEVTLSNGAIHAFITGVNGIGMTDLGTLYGISSFASSINDSGQVVGSTISPSGFHRYHAFITGPNGIGMTDLGTLGGSYSLASSINNAGQVVGFSHTGDESNFGIIHAFITSPNGVVMTDLDTLGGGDRSDKSFAYSINNSGQVVGETDAAQASSLNSHAFITGPNGVGITDLGTLGGSNSFASSINDSGQVVGVSDIAHASSLNSHAFITSPNGVGMTDLGTLGGYRSSATDINNSGEVVGNATVSGHFDYHAFIFSHGGITDLSLLPPVVTAGWSDLSVAEINDNGQMVGKGLHNGHYEAFLLSYTTDTVFDPKPIYVPPVPEPETYAMLAAGLGLLGFMARRRKVPAT